MLKLFKSIVIAIRSFFFTITRVFSLNFILGSGKPSLDGAQYGLVNLKKRIMENSILDSISSLFTKNVLYGNEAVKKTSGSLVLGTFIMLIFFGVFGVWASFAPLEGAVIVFGEVISSSDRKIIQHLEGGIIKKIIVNSGDSVKAGQPLIYLDNSNSKSMLDSLNERLASLYAVRDRLVSIRDGESQVKFSQDLLNLEGVISKEKIIFIQNEIFKDHNIVLNGKKNIINNRIAQLKEQLTVAESALSISKKQYEIAKDDIISKRKLLKDGYISKSQMGIFESQYADVEGRFLQANSNVYNSREKIYESELGLKDLQNTDLKQVIDELNNVEIQLSEFLSKKKIALDVYERSTIKSPIDGVITDIKYHTEGGVILPGSEIMTITPDGDPLIIESKIPVNRIEEIISAQNNTSFFIKRGNLTGLRVRVRLTSYSSRNVGVIEGVADKVSADSIQDKVGSRYYSVRVRMPNEELSKFNGLKLYPGMPAQVMIITSSRTLVSYLLSPILSTMERSLRER